MQRYRLWLRFGSLFLGLLCLLGVAPAMATDLPKIAVTDLSYEEQVSSFFKYSHTDTRARARETFNGESMSASQHEESVTGEIRWIERGELHKFTGDVKGALIKSGNYRLMQGRPWASDSKVALFDVIERIKQGYYPGADYVLFGSISSIESRNEAIPVQGTTSVNYMLNLELVVDFSLVNTKTFEVVAGFTAMGEGRDARLISQHGAVISLSRGRVVAEASRTLGEAVAAEMMAQFSPESGALVGRQPVGAPSFVPPAPPVRVYQ